ncbi:MAG: Phosphoglycerate mutase family [Phycisphaerales bacterium]|nr:Phosphoglycerate mutase family [Phycisphaerales bacterium]
MTRVLLIQAAPTPWDTEGRMGGNPMLPLTTDGEVALRKTLQTLGEPAIAALYTYMQNQACEQAGKLVARHFNVRVRDNEALEPISMGLWQGLTREELRFRFPTVFPQWEENPLSVNPPQGESIEAATERFRAGLGKILRRYRGGDGAIALVLRPLSLQVSAGLLRGEDLQTIIGHLHERTPVESIDVSDDVRASMSVR